MARNSYSARVITVLWNSLIGVTFLVCSLVVYNFLLQDSLCPSQSGCSTSSKPTAEKLQNEECNSVCTTTECLYISNYILDHLDETVDPCTDFYKFACGKFIDKYQTHANFSFFNEASESFMAILKDVIETSTEPRGTAANKLKVVYDSCINIGSSEIRDIDSYINFLKHIGIRNWPHLSSNFSFVNPQLPEVLGKLVTYGEHMFFEVGKSFHDVTDLVKNFGARRNLSITYSATKHPVEYIEAPFKRTLQRLGLDFKTTENIWKDFVAIENNIMDEIQRHVHIDEPLETIKCQEEKRDAMIMLCKILDSVHRNGRLKSRFHRHQFHLTDVTYSENVFGVIKNYSDRAIANYIATGLFSNNWEYMDFFARKSYKLDRSNANGQTYEVYATLHKAKYCIEWIILNMPLPLGAIYVDKMWSDETENEVKDIVKNIINAVADTIRRQKWIEDLPKEEFLLQVLEHKNVILQIVEDMKNKTKINMKYKKFHPTQLSFLRNIWLTKKLEFSLSLEENDENEDSKGYRNYKDFSPFVVNAYGGGYIYLTFGILSPPFFKHKFPKLFNLGKVGFISSHEIGHSAFIFLEYSSEGRTRDAFKEKAQCLIDQYFKFEKKSIKRFVQGNFTVSENFPDNMGINVIEKIAEAYMRNMAKSGFSLPLINYSPEELFYIFYAQTWCEVRTLEKQIFHIELDPHSPPEYRIIGALQNSVRFSEVFNCSKTSYMNPQNKCILFG